MATPRRDPKLRASDADRDAVAEQLREHYATGRLRLDELDQRLGEVYAAQTYGELEPLVEDMPGPGPYSDLPVPFPTAPAAPFEHGWHDGDLTHGGPAWGAWVSGSLVCWGIWLANVVTGGGLEALWPVWVTVPWGAKLVADAVTDRAAPGQQRQLRQRRERRDDRRRLK